MSKRTSKLTYIASRISTIPTLPTVISKMLEMVDNPRTDARRLARVISNDQSLTARILKTANSAFYGFSREISTVDTAIIVMGFNAVKEMGLSLSVFDAFKNMGTVESFNVNRYWEHSVAVAISSKIIARRLLLPKSEELFVAGLLHDIGKMVFAQYLPDDFNTVVAQQKQASCSFHEAERHVMDITHAGIGGLIAHRWHLPERIEHSIRYHHYHGIDTPHCLEGIITDFADLLAHRAGVCNEGHRKEMDISPHISHAFEERGVILDDSFVDSCIEEMFLELDSTEFLEIFVPD
ncbi:HDOD domain-containing protein [Chitinivibrio alkaliphilus]|uniref:Metal-dependent phosphohydrolase n=1 Tax=Chitinivibrio alkaliphilus ACht1 TaxID=1313304 RepID=U7DA55_9BACT|nr:HDOD domain-containing protein [Chitinivibrio alkaliphilus]ERP38897.1 metal-dependent phosphohydrolase [Chitinivibrio alkaliphilus ACht1]